MAVWSARAVLEPANLTWPCGLPV
ncbi:hypothetical protein F383_16491 [Gossypium arboreum]|uniref:Uncharacterized protein n=1 Tax=Gossypium arboreum TaxID=29729 RepID=A0A0B0PR97_GOSAR|nr:hypothetical protein F383_16491 [Gossypium arboreum]